MHTRIPAFTIANRALGVIATCLLAMPATAANIIIDGFAADQGPLSVSPLLGPLSDASSASGAQIVGGERDLVLSTDAGASPFSSSAQVAGGVAQLADNSQFSSNLLFQWDGADGNPNALDETGLGGIDLTFGGNNAIEIGLAFDDLPATLEMRIYSGGGTVSSVLFPGTGLIFTDVSIWVPFELFMGDADINNVGAIELFITSPLNGLDISFNYVQTGLAPVPVPAAVWMFASALLGLFATSRRR